MIERQKTDRRTVTLAAHIRMMLSQALAAVAMLLIGVIVALGFISGWSRLWDLAANFWGIK